MSKLTKQTKKLLPGGTYRAKIDSIIETKGQFGPQLEFDFRIHESLTGTGPSTVVHAWAKAVLAEDSKLGLWVKAILGSVPEDLDTDKLIGLQCLVELGQAISKSGLPCNTVVDVGHLKDDDLDEAPEESEIEFENEEVK